MATGVVTISEADYIASVRDALQYVSYFHPPDFIRYLTAAYEREESPAAKSAIGQVLVNSRLAALGRRPVCQDTGSANVFVKIGMEARLDSKRSLQDIIDEAVRTPTAIATTRCAPPSSVDQIFPRKNSGDNTPGVVHVELVAGDRIASMYRPRAADPKTSRGSPCWSRRIRWPTGS